MHLPIVSSSLKLISNEKPSDSIRGLTCTYTKGCRFETLPGEGPISFVSNILPQMPKERSLPPAILTLEGWKGQRESRWGMMSWVGGGRPSWTAGQAPTLHEPWLTRQSHIAFTRFRVRNLDKYQSQ